VCVLIDEIESLAHARNHCISGTFFTTCGQYFK
jgi:hypothetical protein